MLLRKVKLLEKRGRDGLQADLGIFFTIKPYKTPSDIIELACLTNQNK
jgi:hypothetical protein